MFKIIKDCKKPEFAIITPLRPEDKISKDTKVTVKRNQLPFIWASYSDDGNIVQNYKAGMKALEKEKGFLPSYIIKIDNDTVWSRNTLDNMCYSLKDSFGFEAYTYCSFEYKGTVQASFRAIKFDHEKLKKGNYISSNSMFKTKIIKEIDMPEDSQYERLLDWVYFLKLMKFGFIGKPCKGYFYVNTNSNSISARDKQDYQLKFQRVKRDFIDN